MTATQTKVGPSMKLSVGCGAYDRTWPLAASMIRPAGFDLDWTILPPEEVFLRGMLGGEFHVTEMSMSTYILLQSRGDSRYVGMPAFVSRKFRHSAIYLRTDAGIEDPRQLVGRRVGVPEYQLTANVWVRGMLSDDYGVRSEDIHWVIGGIDEPGRVEKVPITLPDRFSHSRIGPTETLWQLMEGGEIDAIIAPRAPKAFSEGNPKIRRLFADVARAEKAYFARTGIFPPMHIIGVRKDIVERFPHAPAALLSAFGEAKQVATRELHQFAYDTVMLPWLEDHLRETEAALGRDYWPYGLDANTVAIEAICRYSHEQGITARRMTVEELFPGS
jgi:4,5-dihydroxyphthalate decarboxylase